MIYNVQRKTDKAFACLNPETRALEWHTENGGRPRYRLRLEDDFGAYDPADPAAMAIFMKYFVTIVRGIVSDDTPALNPDDLQAVPEEE